MSKTIKFRFVPDRFINAPELYETYDEINEKYFNSQLPIVRIGYYPGVTNDEGEEAYAVTMHLRGYKHTSHILLNPDIRDWPKTVEATLIHEMIHVKMPKGVHHGPKFQRLKKKLIRAGAFDDLL